MSMRCEVRLVDEDALPVDQLWVIGMTHRGERFLFIKRGAFTPAVLEEAWGAGLGLNLIPAQSRHDRAALRIAT